MPSRTGFVYHDHFLDHDTGPVHPERPDRLRSVVTRLQASGLWKDVQHLIIERVSEEWLLKVHTADHIRYVRESVEKRRGILDEGDTIISDQSYDVALLAAGGVLAAIDVVAAGMLRNAFCAVRPPGHHAESRRPMGFCLFNNVAVGARYAQAAYGMERVAIVDWDVHHGNGTQEIFYQDQSVLFVSTHQYPFYPGTGSREERGEGEGRDYTLNIPLPAGTGEQVYLEAFEREILPLLDGYRPDLIIISAGFDAHRDDPLANMELTEQSFSRFTELMMDAADRYCEGRLVSVLEGGYNLDALAGSVEAHLRILMR